MTTSTLKPGGTNVAKDLSAGSKAKSDAEALALLADPPAPSWWRRPASWILVC